MVLGYVLSRLDDLEEVVWEPYHKDGLGRPPRNPLGIFKALIVKRIRNIPSDRELYRRLWSSPKLREICDIEDYEKPYHPSQLTRFRQRVGPERFRLRSASKPSLSASALKRLRLLRREVGGRSRCLKKPSGNS